MFEDGKKNERIMQHVECGCGSINYQAHRCCVLFDEKNKKIGVSFSSICEQCNQIITYETICLKGNIYTSKYFGE